MGGSNYDAPAQTVGAFWEVEDARARLAPLSILQAGIKLDI